MWRGDGERKSMLGFIILQHWLCSFFSFSLPFFFFFSTEIASCCIALASLVFVTLLPLCPECWNYRHTIPCNLLHLFSAFAFTYFLLISNPAILWNLICNVFITIHLQLLLTSESLKNVFLNFQILWTSAAHYYKSLSRLSCPVLRKTTCMSLILWHFKDLPGRPRVAILGG